MRGKGMRNMQDNALVRITPAHAGKRHPLTPPFKSEEDHPRPCGEKPLRTGERLPFLGSPPPMRGKDVKRYGFKSASRITPAHAGKSTNFSSGRSRTRDHPRPCGEKLMLAPYVCWDVGSPPPMRGKAHNLAQYLALSRITPAHAGKRHFNGGIWCHKQDHPRPCGEKGMTSSMQITGKGSPPPMRGKEQYG